MAATCVSEVEEPGPSWSEASSGRQCIYAKLAHIGAPELGSARLLGSLWGEVRWGLV
jgi:hypothetical protein